MSEGRTAPTLAVIAVFLGTLGIASPAFSENLVTNGDFAAGMTGWNTWIQRDGNTDFAATAGAGEMSISGTDINGGVYQQIDTGGPGRVVTVIGTWRSDPTVASAMWAEVLVINANRLPVDGVDESNGVNGTVLLYKNDTFTTPGGWSGAIPKTAPVAYVATFVATAAKATIILKTGNAGGSLTGTVFDNMAAYSVAPSATINSLPPGFTHRSYTFPVTQVVALAQSPTSHFIYAVSYSETAAATKFYRINSTVGLSATEIPGLGSLLGYAQGMTFDSDGNIYMSSFFGDIIKGVDTNPDPAIDSFSFSQIVNLPESQIGTLHGVGGIAVGPDNKLYINSGSESHYGYLPDGSPEIFVGRLNARILRCNLDGSNVEVFAEGIRNTFDLAFRSDGALFGTENGPNTNCNYGDEFNRIDFGHHYGFPYRYGSDLSGDDASIACQNSGGGNVLGPPPLPNGLVTTPAWGNYGPDAKPGPGDPGYADGGVYYGFNPHSSPDGISWYDTSKMDPAAVKFPAEYQGRLFLCRFGYLENVPKVGLDLLTLRLDDANEGFITNRFLDGLNRPVDVLCAYDGKLYVLEFNQNHSFPDFTGWTDPARLHQIAYEPSPEILLSTSVINRTVSYLNNPTQDTFTVANSGLGTLNFSVQSLHPWMSVNPTSDTSTGPGDAKTITITYDLGTSLPGVYVGLVRVTSGDASNSPRDVTVTVNLKARVADFDADGDVDLSDFSTLQLCFNGPNRPPVFGGCGPADMDEDGDVDLSDFSVFLSCFNGPGRPPTPTCP